MISYINMGVLIYSKYTINLALSGGVFKFVRVKLSTDFIMLCVYWLALILIYYAVFYFTRFIIMVVMCICKYTKPDLYIKVFYSQWLTIFNFFNSVFNDSLWLLSLVSGLGVDPALHVDIFQEFDLVRSSAGVSQVQGFHNESRSYLFEGACNCYLTSQSSWHVMLYLCFSIRV